MTSRPPSVSQITKALTSRWYGAVLHPELSNVYGKHPKGNFVIRPQVTQRSKRSGTYVADPETRIGTMNNIDVSNDIGGGIFVYTPPYMIVDASMTDGSVLASGLPNKSTLDKNSRKATTRYPQLNFPKDGRAIADMSSLIIFDTSYDTCEIHLAEPRVPVGCKQ